MSTCQKCCKLERELSSLKLENTTLREEVKSILKSKAALLESCEEAQDGISNKLFREIRRLKEEKLSLCCEVEQERQQLLDAVERRLKKLRLEKVELEAILEAEQECIVNKLLAASTPPLIPKPGKQRHFKEGDKFTCANTDLRNALSETEDQNSVLIIENVKLQQKLRRQSLESDVNSYVQIPQKPLLQSPPSSMPASAIYKTNK